VREEAPELISQDPSLQTPPWRVAEEPLWLFGLEIQKGHPHDSRHPRCGVPKKGHRHHREQSPGQTPKGSIARPEVPASKSRRGVEPAVAVEEGQSGRHRRSKERKPLRVGRPYRSRPKTYTLIVVEGVMKGEPSEARDVQLSAQVGGEYQLERSRRTSTPHPRLKLPKQKDLSPLQLNCLCSLALRE
jgi:hypothetical protein